MPSKILDRISAWIGKYYGINISDLMVNQKYISELSIEYPFPFRAVKINGKTAFTANKHILKKLEPIISKLSTDEIFSTFGSFELSKITLPFGYGVWGPTWFMFTDTFCFDFSKDINVIDINEIEILNIDNKIFWHVAIQESIKSYGVYKNNNLIAISTVQNRGDDVYEIAMDVHPNAQYSGLGKALVSKAVNYVVSLDKIAMASVGIFNIPSNRTLRSVGMEMLITDMKGLPGDFMIEPQPLGEPARGHTVLNRYPYWAMNQNIKENFEWYKHYDK
ncbi:MAG: GNAT family N-acetyltransferase [Dehalococcoidia bacterium]